MRYFVAITFEDKTKNQIRDIMEMLKDFTEKGKYVRVDNLHLTLEFLGEIDSEKVAAVKHILADFQFEKFTLKLTELNYFNKRRGNIYWLGLVHNPKLVKLQKYLHQELKEKTFALEEREYTPHITIGRKMKFKKEFELSQIEEKIAEIVIDAKEVALMEAKSIDGILTYTPVYVKALR